MLPVAILQNDENDSSGLLDAGLAKRGVPATPVEAFAGDALPGLAQVSGSAILGGHMGAYDEEAFPFLVEEKSLVREAVSRDVPVLGICLGCQIIADALGGRAYRVEPQEAGLIDIRLTDAGLRDPVLAGVTGPFASWHHDSWDLPSGGTLLGVSDLYPQALRVGSAVGVQFHPEVTAQVLQDWVRRGDASLRESGVDPSEFLSMFQSHRESFVRRADGLFGAWISEVQGQA